MHEGDLYFIPIVDRNVGKVVPEGEQGVHREVLLQEDLSDKGVTFRYPL